MQNYAISSWNSFATQKHAKSMVYVLQDYSILRLNSSAVHTYQIPTIKVRARVWPVNPGFDTYKFLNTPFWPSTKIAHALFWPAKNFGYYIEIQHDLPIFDTRLMKGRHV